MDNLSIQLHKNKFYVFLVTVVNHIIYADALHSAKGFLALLDMCYSCGCKHTTHNTMLLNLWSCTLNLESQIFLKQMTLGGNRLHFFTTCKYHGHIISTYLSDERDIQAKVKPLFCFCFVCQQYILRQQFHVYSTA